MKLLKAEKKIEIENNKVLVDGEDVDTAIEKFLNENPFLVRAIGGSGSPHTTEPEPQSTEEKLKQALKKLLQTGGA